MISVVCIGSTCKRSWASSTLVLTAVAAAVPVDSAVAEARGGAVAIGKPVAGGASVADGKLVLVGLATGLGLSRAAVPVASAVAASSVAVAAAGRGVAGTVAKIGGAALTDGAGPGTCSDAVVRVRAGCTPTGGAACGLGAHPQRHQAKTTSARKR